MERALVVLVAGAWLTLLLEAPAGPRPLLGVALGTVFALLAVAAAVYADRERAGRGPGLPRALAVAYVAVQLPLGFLVFSLAGAGVGATLLLMVLVSQSVRLLPLPGAVAVTAAVPLVHLGMGWTDGLRNGLGTLAAAAFTAVVTELLQREQRARASLGRAHDQLRTYAAQAEQLATTQERNRLARDIHDGLGHHLTVVQMQVQAARAVLAQDPARADAVLDKAQRQAAEALAEVRRSVAALREPRPAVPLAEALAALTAETTAAGVPTRLQVRGAVRPLPREAEESVYRAAQEGLTNVRKHAAATRADVLLDYGPAGAREPVGVRLEVRDDGSGAAASSTGFGLLGLRERAARLGGRVEVASEPGAGTALRFEVPA